MAAACVVSAVAQDPKVIGVSFNSSGIVLDGTDAANHTAGKSTKFQRVGVLQDPQTGRYLGTTNAHYDGSNRKNIKEQGFYWVKYNADDALGEAFSSGSVTWEILFRLNSWCCVSYDASASNSTSRNGTARIFASLIDKNSGWQIGAYPGDKKGINYGIRFEYFTSGANSINSGAAGLFSTDTYNHVIVTLDKANKTAKIYLNGKLVKNYTDDKLGADFTFPQIGDPTGETDMWFCLGGTPNEANLADENNVLNMNRSTFVFANIYNTVMTKEQVEARYNDPIVQHYTNITTPTTSDLLWDVFPRAGNTVTDESPFHKIDIAGTLNTDFNETYMRYEVVNPTPNSKNFAWRDFFNDPFVCSKLDKTMAIEFFCKSNSATPAATSSPLSFQQGGGGYGFEFTADGTIKFNDNAYGFFQTGAGGLGLPLATDAAKLTTDYTHYVVTIDRTGNVSKMYINGVEDQTNSRTEENIFMQWQSHSFCYAPWQWFCFNGDTRANRHSACDYPFDGNIVYGRVWGKYLTKDDVTALYSQATGTSTDVTMQSNKLATAVFPYDAVVPTGATAYVVDVIKGSEANMVPYAAEGDVIPYGTPVIIKGDASTYKFNAADLNDDAVVAKIKPAPAKNLLVGSFATKKAQADQLYKISTSAAEFDKAAADDVLDAQQAWLPFETGGEDALTLTENIVLTEAGGAALRAGYPEGYTATGKFSRTFKNAVSSTVCLPYAISSVSGGTLYSFDNITESEGEYTVHMSAASLPTTANTPYLFMPSADGEVTFSGMMTVPASMAAGNTTSGDWTFEGTYEKTTWSGLPAGSSAVYGYAAKAQNTINPGDFVKLKMTGEAYTPAFRAVMKYTGGASARSLKGTVPTLPSRLKVVLTDGNGNVTEIGSLEILQEQETWFTIDGKELQAKPTKRGIYIRNGKKVFVK